MDPELERVRESEGHGSWVTHPAFSERVARVTGLRSDPRGPRQILTPKWPQDF